MVLQAPLFFRTRVLLVLLVLLTAGCVSSSGPAAREGESRSESEAPESRTLQQSQPVLHQKIEVPRALLAEEGFMGDLRIGDLNGDGRVDFVVFRTAGGGLKPRFLAAFTLEGDVLWTAGTDGRQPARPGPVAVRDLDGDGRAEVVSFFKDQDAAADPLSMADVVVQVRDGRTGRVLREAAPPALRALRLRGHPANYVHQHLLAANLDGGHRADDFVVKVDSTVLAFNSELETLWTYRTAWNDYGEHTAYVPAVGDIDGDGRDEITGGHYLLSGDDGTVLWEQHTARHMDSVAITEWDDGHVRVIASGYGQVLGADGDAVLRLGREAVPHGQEVRVADFDTTQAGPEMVIRHKGHRRDAMLVSNEGNVMRRFQLNASPNHTGMEAVRWNGAGGPDLLYNGGVLWRGHGEKVAALPGLPAPLGEEKMGWYHCIPADVAGDEREEVVPYNPWDRRVWIYTPAPLRPEAFAGYRAGPRQYNPRLMD